MTLNLTPLNNAVASLEEILAQPQNKYIAAGVVQNFKVTFELAWKSLQRFLKTRGVETGSPAQVLRAAFKEDLIPDLELWLTFLKMRNLTVHTYNQDVASEVVEVAKKMPAATRSLLAKLVIEP